MSELINKSISFLDGKYWLRVDHPPQTPKPRWLGGHKRLLKMLDENQDQYISCLNDILTYSSEFLSIPVFYDESNPSAPHYYNNFLPALDGMALYTFIAERNPATYLEVGSGNSTKFAARAIQNYLLDTKITSIDPQPRAEIDSLCDTVIRQPLEDVPLDLFECLKEGDVMVFDGSHRAFTNSDVVVFFLDILPNLAPGVLVGVHDIFLPWDYPESYGAGRSVQ